MNKRFTAEQSSKTCFRFPSISIKKTVNPSCFTAGLNTTKENQLVTSFMSRSFPYYPTTFSQCTSSCNDANSNNITLVNNLSIRTELES